MSLTVDELSTAVAIAPPRVQTMIEALLRAQNQIVAHDSGRIELSFAEYQVKMSLNVNLGCYKFTKRVLSLTST